MFLSVENLLITFVVSILLIIGWCLRSNPFSALHFFVIDLSRRKLCF